MNLGCKPLKKKLLVVGSGGGRGSVGRSGENGRGRFLGEVRVARAAVWLAEVASGVPRSGANGLCDRRAGSDILYRQYRDEEVEIVLLIELQTISTCCS